MVPNQFPVNGMLREVKIIEKGATISKYQKGGATLSKGWVRQLVKGGATFIRTPFTVLGMLPSRVPTPHSGGISVHRA